MENNDTTNKLLIFNHRRFSKTSAWLLFIFFGWHYGSIRQPLTQFFYYITLGGCGLWTLGLLFFINSNVNEYNRVLAKEIGLSNDEILLLGISNVTNESNLSYHFPSSDKIVRLLFYFGCIVLGYFILKSIFYQERYKSVYINENKDGRNENIAERMIFDNDTIAYIELSKKFHSINNFNKKYNNYKINKGLNLKQTYDSLYVLDSKNKNISLLFSENRSINDKVRHIKDSIQNDENIIENYYKGLSIENDVNFIKISDETYRSIGYYKEDKPLSETDYYIDIEYKYNNNKPNHCKILIYSKFTKLFTKKLKYKEYTVDKILNNGVYYNVIEILVTKDNINIIRGFFTNNYNLDNPFPYMSEQKKENFINGLDYFIKDNI